MDDFDTFIKWAMPQLSNFRPTMSDFLGKQTMPGTAATRVSKGPSLAQGSAPSRASIGRITRDQIPSGLPFTPAPTAAAPAASAGPVSTVMNTVRRGTQRLTAPLMSGGSMGGPAGAAAGTGGRGLLSRLKLPGALLGAYAGYKMLTAPNERQDYNQSSGGMTYSPMAGYPGGSTY